MTDRQATCHTPDNNDRDRRMQGIGGSGWWYTVDQVISRIEGNTDSFFTNVSGSRANVVVAKRSDSGRKYIKTTADGIEPNNLLSLPTCS